jgi:molybdopterin-guanine dinucleotide biosynthesis protein B
MRLIISIVGKSDAGKTTLLEKLVGELKRRCFKVAVIKHSHHTDDLDTREKDTWRFTRAGSEFSAINSLDNLAIYRHLDHHFDPQEISSFVLWDYDIILMEGFKESDYPKIEVHRRAQGQEILTDPQSLLAVVTDEPLDVSVPQFSHDDTHGIADLIEKEILCRQKENDIDLVVNGAYEPIGSALKDLLANTMCAMIPAGGREIKTMHFSLRRKA